MPYTAEISRTNPTCFLFLIDQSSSMSDPFGGDVDGETGKTKSDGVADAINRMLQTICLKCTTGESILDRYFIGVIGYGDTVGHALGGALSGRDLVAVSDLAKNPLAVEPRTKWEDDGAGGLLEKQIKFPIWFHPVADGGTPMAEALQMAQATVSAFVSQRPTCYPPMVFNITDGEPNDAAAAESAAQAIKGLASQDGNVLLFNTHISSVKATPLLFPEQDSGLPDVKARLLFRMSSVLPAPMVEMARKEKGLEGKLTLNSRGFVFNANLGTVIKFLDIGTRKDRNVR